MKVVHSHRSKPEADNTFQEERRLFYVALTRTKRTLDIFTSNNKEKQSRFIRELKADFQHTASRNDDLPSHSELQRLLDHGIWNGEEALLAETELTGDEAISLVEHAHRQTATGIPIVILYTSIVTATSVPTLSNDELVQFYHWYVEQTDDYFNERELDDLSLQLALEPFIRPTETFNHAIKRSYENAYQNDPMSEFLSVLDLIDQQALIEKPTQPGFFDEVIERHVYDAGHEKQDCSTIVTVLEQTGRALVKHEQEAKRIMACVQYLDEMTAQYTNMQIPFPFPRSNELQWVLRDLESVGSAILTSDELFALRSLKQWCSDPDQFDIVAAASHSAYSSK